MFISVEIPHTVYKHTKICICMTKCQAGFTTVKDEWLNHSTLKCLAVFSIYTHGIWVKCNAILLYYLFSQIIKVYDRVT